MKNPLARLRRDESCHWYLVPVGMVEDFDRLQAAMEGMDPMNAGTSPECGEFCEKFDQFRIDGYQDVVCLLPS